MAQYIDNKELLRNILRYQEINEDEGEWLKTWRGKLKDKEEKQQFYDAKKARREAMSQEERDAEEIERAQLIATLGEQFSKIIKGRLSTRHFNRYEDDMKNEMIQNCMLVMLSKIRNFKRDLENPFAFFTQVCWVELVRTLREHYEYKNQHVSLSFISDFSDVFD